MSMGMSSPFPLASMRESSSRLQQQPTITAVAPETSQPGGEDTDAAALGLSTGIDITASQQQQLHPNGRQQHLLQTQQQQHPYAYSRNDKALPLTPTSEYDSREGTPLIHASPFRQTSTSIDEVLAEEGSGDGGSPLYTRSSLEPEPQLECGPDQEELSQSSSFGSESGGFTQDITSEVFEESARPTHNGDTNEPGRFNPVEERSERAEGDDIGLSLVDSIEDEQQQTLRHRPRPSHTHLGSGTVKPLPALPETSSS